MYNKKSPQVETHSIWLWFWADCGTLFGLGRYQYNPAFKIAQEANFRSDEIHIDSILNITIR
jgi:hypothetical protein